MEGIELPVFDNTIAFETLTVSSTSKALTAAKYRNAGEGNFKDARVALITIDGTAGTNDIRFTTDGTAPVAATTGHLAQAKKPLVIRGFGNITNFRAIRESSDATIHVSYYR